VRTASFGNFVRFLNKTYNKLPETPTCLQSGKETYNNFVIYKNPTDLESYRDKVNKTIPIFQEKHFTTLSDSVYDWFLIGGKLYFVQPRGTWLQFGTDDVTDLNRIFDMYDDETLRYMASGTLSKNGSKVEFNFYSLAWKQFTARYKTKVTENLINIISGIFEKLGYKAEFTYKTLLTYKNTSLKTINYAKSLGFVPTYFPDKGACEDQYRASHTTVQSDDLDRYDLNRLGGAKRRRKSKSPRRKTIRRRSKSNRRSHSRSRK